MKLLQISDPHFGTEQPPVVQGLLDFTRRLVPDLVLLSGDITQRATAAQFDAGRRFCDAVTACAGTGAPVPLLAIPGNHDLPLVNLLARALWPYARYRTAFGAALEASWDGPLLQLTALDTTRRWRHKNGQLSNAQIERVAARLRQATPRQLRVVVAHHPLAVLREQDRENLAHGHARALRAWSAAGADLVLGGHIHLPYVLGVHGRQPALPRKLWVVQAGTALSSRVRHEAGNSVNVLHIGDADADADDTDTDTTGNDTAAAAGGAARHCRVERWDWQADAQAFVRVNAQDLPCGAHDGA